ncbi:hypothetical protein HW132_35425 [Brasilonema sp. CT11]|nr:hypothetical protein [Brasilonema sp. CT11]
MEPHPLDLLSPDEIRTAITIVKKKFPPHIRFVIVGKYRVSNKNKRL